MQIAAYPCQRIEVFQSLVQQIEAMGLGPMERRRLFEQARDETGVTALSSRNAEAVKVPITARRTEDEVRRRRNETDRRYRERLKAKRMASQSGQAA